MRFPKLTGWRGGLVVAAGVAGFLAFTHFALEPVYRLWLTDRPVVGALGAYTLAFASALEFAPRSALFLVSPEHEHRVSLVRWFLMAGIAAGGYALAFLVLQLIWRSTKTRDPKPNAGPEPSAASNCGQPSRRQLLNHGIRAGVVVAGAGAVGVGGWSMLVEPRRFEVSHRRIPIRGLDPSLAGLRVVHLTDLHHSNWIPLTYLRDALQAANEARPDLVVLTGDYVRYSVHYIRPVIDALAMLRPTAGVVATMGNHDWWEGVETTRRAFARVGIPLIDNDRRFVTPDRTLVHQSDRGLCVAGIGDLWTDRQDYRAALDGVAPDIPRLLLSHNPDVAEEKSFLKASASGMRVDLMLSGHTHGGQISLPRLGAPRVPSQYGNKYLTGVVQGPACRVFCCRGVGLAGVPFRFRVRPEVAVLELSCVTT